MFQLLALAPDDGWAYVRRGEALLLVRPPYSQWTLSLVQEEDLERALSLQGFHAADRSFSDWGSLIGYLRAEIVATREAQGRGKPSSEKIQKLVRLAPPHILSRYLDRIETELLPNGELDPAFNLLKSLLRAEGIQKNPTLFERTMRLLDECEAARAQRRESLSTHSEQGIETRFQRASHQYGAAEIAHLAGLVSQRHQVISIGG